MFTCCLGNGRFGVSTFFATSNTLLGPPPAFTDEQSHSSDNGSAHSDLSGNGVNQASNGTASVVSPIYHGVQSSVRILGNFQRLLALSHANVCRYIDAMVGRHEQVVFVQEFYENTLKDAIKLELYKENMQACLRIGCQMALALSYLHSEGIVVGNLAPASVMLCSADTWPPVVKLFNYGLFWSSENGTLVEFPLASPPYLAPEIVMTALSYSVPIGNEQGSGSDFSEFSDFNGQLAQALLRCTVFSDVWALGVVLSEVFTATELSSTVSNLHQLIAILVNIALKTSGESVTACDMLFRTLKFKLSAEDCEKYKDDCALFERLLRGCLEQTPSQRLLPKVALATVFPQDVIGECTRTPKGSVLLSQGLNPFSPRRRTNHHQNNHHLRINGFEMHNGQSNGAKEQDMFEAMPESNQVTYHMRQTRPIEEVYYLLSLVSPDPRVLVKRASMQIKSLPSICKLAPLFLSKADRSFGAVADRGSLYARAVVEMPLEPLVTRLDNLQVQDLYCLLESYPELVDFETESSRRRQEFFAEIQKQPLIIRERDPEYQLHRCVLFHRLLEGYPFTRAKLLEAARVDIVPLYRGLVWCCLLNVPSDVEEYYTNIDTETLHPSHRQIDVDIPRCHQYDDLLASHIGRIKLKRVLTAWLRKNSNNVYWQGLDSLLAPFLRLNFTNEALALACFQRFIDKYLNNFFTRDNSDVVREYLCVFSHLIAFHDAELSAHLQKIGFVPDLYAISWFLTAFAHVFPLTKLYHLYDTLLQYDNSFLICVGLAVLHQMRSKLISFEFNDCILLSSDMSDFETSTLVNDAVSFFKSTPPSLLRHPLSEPAQHTSTDANKAAHSEAAFTSGSSRRAAAAALISANNSAAEAVVLTDPCGRLSVQDLQSLWNTGRDKVVVIDIRTAEEFSHGCFPGSINVPFSSMSAAAADPSVLDPQLQRLIFDMSPVQADGNSAGSMRQHSAAVGTVFVVVCGKNGFTSAADFCRRLAVDFLMSRVCMLSGGTDALARASLLVIP